MKKGDETHQVQVQTYDPSYGHPYPDPRIETRNSDEGIACHVYVGHGIAHEIERSDQNDLASESALIANDHETPEGEKDETPRRPP